MLLLHRNCSISFILAFGFPTIRVLFGNDCTVVWGLTCCLVSVGAATKVEGEVNMTYFMLFLVTSLVCPSCEHHIILVRKNYYCSFWLDDWWKRGELAGKGREKQNPFVSVEAKNFLLDFIKTWRKVVRTWNGVAEKSLSPVEMTW